jgi:hypothetical protein
MKTPSRGGWNWRVERLLHNYFLILRIIGGDPSISKSITYNRKLENAERATYSIWIVIRA